MNMTCNKQNYLLYIYIYMYVLPVDCLSIALDAHVLSHNDMGPGLGHKKSVPTATGTAALFGPWSRARADIHYG